MKNVTHNKIIAFFPVILIISYYSIVHIITKGFFFNFIDNSTLISLNSSLEKLFSLWSYGNLGIMNAFAPANIINQLMSYAILQFVKDPGIVQMVLFAFVNSAIYISAYFSFTKIQKIVHNRSGILYPVLAATFYSFNATVVSLQGIIDSTFIIFVLSPILLYKIIYILTSKRALTTQNMFVTSMIIFVGFFLPHFYISLVFSGIIFGLSYVLIHGVKKIQLLNIASLAILSLILAIPILYIFFIGITSSSTSAFQTTTNHGIIFLKEGLQGVMQFRFDWHKLILSSSRIPNHYLQFVNSILYKLSVSGIWIIVLLPIILFRKLNKEKSKWYILFLIFLIFGIFFIKGDQLPFGFLNTEFYNVHPITRLLRTPSSKFSIQIMLGISMLVLFSLNTFKDRKITLITLILILMQSFLFFNPNRLIHNNENYRVVRLNQEQIDIIDILNNDEQEGSLLPIPNNQFGLFYSDNTIFTGRDLFSQFVKRPITYQDGRAYPNTVNHINRLLSKLDPRAIGDSHISFILLRRDIGQENYNVAEVDKLSALLNEGYYLVYDGTEYDLYELRPEYRKERISITLTADKDVVILPNKKNPTRYDFFLDAGSLEEGAVVKFKTSFSDLWQIEISPNDMFKSTHTKYNNFGNAWTISPKDTQNPMSQSKQVHVSVYFNPQNTLLKLSLISVVAYMIGMLIYKFIIFNENRN